MSTNRIGRKAGSVDGYHNLPRGPNGRGLCRQCQTEVPPGRRTFCSKECVDQWRILTDPGYVRSQVFKRDHGVCALCGADTMADRQRKTARGTGHLWHADHIIPVIEGGGECGLDNYRTLCVPCHYRETAVLRKRLAAKRRPPNKQETFDFDGGAEDCRGVGVCQGCGAVLSHAGEGTE